MIATRTRSLHRFAPNATVGFAAGDANLYRYVGNNPTNKIDPSGLEVVTPDKAPLDEVFFDELLYFFFRANENSNDTDHKAYANTFRAFIKLITSKQEGLRVNIRYVTNVACEAQFASHAANTSVEVGSINIFIGHGTGGNDPSTPNPTILFVFREIFEKLFEHLKTDDKLKGDNRPLYAFVGCFGGNFNAAIPDSCRLPGHMTTKEAIRAYELHKYLQPLLKSIKEIVEKRLADKKPVVINLYFATDGLRKGRDGHLPKDGSYRCEKWK